MQPQVHKPVFYKYREVLGAGHVVVKAWLLAGSIGRLQLNRAPAVHPVNQDKPSSTVSHFARAHLTSKSREGALVRREFAGVRRLWPR